MMEELVVEAEALDRRIARSHSRLESSLAHVRAAVAQAIGAHAPAGGIPPAVATSVPNSHAVRSGGISGHATNQDGASHSSLMDVSTDAPASGTAGTGATSADPGGAAVPLEAVRALKASLATSVPQIKRLLQEDHKNVHVQLSKASKQTDRVFPDGDVALCTLGLPVTLFDTPDARGGLLSAVGEYLIRRDFVDVATSLAQESKCALPRTRALGLKSPSAASSSAPTTDLVSALAPVHALASQVRMGNVQAAIHWCSCNRGHLRRAGFGVLELELHLIHYTQLLQGRLWVPTSTGGCSSGSSGTHKVSGGGRAVPSTAAGAGTSGTGTGISAPAGGVTAAKSVEMVSPRGCSDACITPHPSARQQRSDSASSTGTTCSTSLPVHHLRVIHDIALALALARAYASHTLSKAIAVQSEAVHAHTERVAGGDTSPVPHATGPTMQRWGSSGCHTYTQPPSTGPGSAVQVPMSGGVGGSAFLHTTVDVRSRLKRTLALGLFAACDSLPLLSVAPSVEPTSRAALVASSAAVPSHTDAAHTIDSSASIGASRDYNATLVERMRASPYSDIIAPQRLIEAERCLLDAQCTLLDIPDEAALETVITGGILALPSIMMMEPTPTPELGDSSGTAGDNAHELACEVTLPATMLFHSVFVCPVSRQQCNLQSNPPMLLACGHVISKDSLTAISQLKARFKCPTCPMVQTVSQALQLTLE